MSISNKKSQILNVIVMTVLSLSKIKSSAISNRSYIDTSVEPGGRGSNYVEFVAFSAAPKKRNRNREISRRYIGTLGPSKDSRRGHVGLASWIPDNCKNLVPRRTIGRRHFQREEWFFVPLRHRHAFRFPALSLRLSPRVVTSFSALLPSHLLFLLLHISLSRSYERKVDSQEDLFPRSSMQPFFSLLVSRKISSISCLLFRVPRITMQSGLHQFREFWRS